MHCDVIHCDVIHFKQLDDSHSIFFKFTYVQPGTNEVLDFICSIQTRKYIVIDD